MPVENQSRMMPRIAASFDCTQHLPNYLSGEE
jgi:hypothetical protein